ncbi:oligodendrocyte-myelin glycoprotein [Anopheles aquasalis]|uniref:oligodendrocyte-myelin glycoprotein n=1 Tax=Anopheles aquasalis TaxID=42839 RepID=UPI00215A3010|nr:oligodendrocyte-myelin glycoprotein [Anopheles aquasalis]XP_050098227.1 oligodendrocyte-myelin glycoprotein [Anopheles aquasalis]XP_050098228.1 oligodendrocyte-myelin glycoprotein [Anopheles aquasalis]XP_050098230.1 oligodendrocyte-myelin glycoprotein [Anopheles aquasalis]XP_050098231.1 oligodendrocyte-myelin glycoprotein [Anopheles aquasalis]
MKQRGVILDWLVPVLLLSAVLLLSTSVTEGKDNYYDAQDDGTDQYAEDDDYDDYTYVEDGGAKPMRTDLAGADKDKSTATGATSTTTTILSTVFGQIGRLKDEPLVSNIFGTLEPYEPIINNVAEDGPKGVQYGCPSGCNCTEGTKNLNCSHRGLTDIPVELPPNVVRLDLSHNNLKVLNVEALQNCTELQALLLAGNVVEQFDKELLIKLNRLALLDLSSNQLSHLASDSFSEVGHSLRQLHLSNNPLVFPDSGPFLELPELEELHLAGCNLTELPEETFSELAGLAVLDLNGNQFDEEMNVNVFEPLANLIKLRLPSLSEDTVRELCEKLPRIDVIDITSYNISCFYLASDTSFEDSIIVDEPKTEQPISTTKEPTSPRSTSVSPMPQKNVNLIRQDLKSGSTNTDRSAREPEQNVKANSSMTKSSSSSSSGPPSSASILHEGADASSSVDGDDERMVKTSTTGTNSQKQGEGGDGTNDGEQKQSLLSSISSETMKQALMGIIGAAVIVLIVGLICRRTGMKSKLCGTKRRPAPTDQVRPAEEIPLNKV